MFKKSAMTVLWAFLGSLAALIGLGILSEETGMRLPAPLAWGWAIQVAASAYLVWALPLGLLRNLAVAAVFLIVSHYVSSLVGFSFMMFFYGGP